MSDSGSKTILAFATGIFVGAAVGAIGGILLAPPDKGSETRRKISSKTGELKDELSDKLDNLKESIEEKKLPR